MAWNKVQTRRLHRAVAPIALLPLLLTVLTGSLFQVAQLSGNPGQFSWLLDLHVGRFGRLDLSAVYPFLNGFGLLMLGVTGLLLWLQSPQRRSKTPTKLP